MLWLIHYYAYRRVNSNGQRVNLIEDGINLTDDTIVASVRDNELAAFLHTSLESNVSRAQLISAARRNLVVKSLRYFDYAIALFGLVTSATLVSGVVVGVSSTVSSLAVILLTIVMILCVLLLVCMTTILEFVAPDGTSQQRYVRT